MKQNFIYICIHIYMCVCIICISLLTLESLFQKESSIQAIRKLWIASPFTIMGMWGLIKNKDETETQITTKEVLVAKVDALFDQGDYTSIYNLLSKYKVIKFSKLSLHSCNYTNA